MATNVCNDPDQPIADIFAMWPETISVFLQHRMLCVGCVIGPFHTIQDICRIYHLDHAGFCKELNAALNE